MRECVSALVVLIGMTDRGELWNIKWSPREHVECVNEGMR